MNRLKELRLEKNLLQSDIAKVLDVSDRAIGNYETGKRDMSTDIVIKLADFFGVSAEYLLGQSNDRNPADPFGLAKIGFNMKEYNPPTEAQKQQIKGLIEVILKDNKKETKEGK